VATTYRLMPRQQPKPEAKKTSQSKPSHGNGDQTAQRRAKKTNAIAVAHTLGLGLEKLGGSWMVLTGLHSTKSVAPQVLTNVAIDSNMEKRFQDFLNQRITYCSISSKDNSCFLKYFKLLCIKK